jgi:hypothetical protein
MLELVHWRRRFSQIRHSRHCPFQVCSGRTRGENRLNLTSHADNDIGTVGARFIAVALMANRTLKGLDLSCTITESRGLHHICDRWFDLKLRAGNPIDHVGVQEFLRALKWNSSLLDLRLSRSCLPLCLVQKSYSGHCFQRENHVGHHWSSCLRLVISIDKKEFVLFQRCSCTEITHFNVAQNSSTLAVM